MRRVAPDLTGSGARQCLMTQLIGIYRRHVANVAASTTARATKTMAATDAIIRSTILTTSHAAASGQSGGAPSSTAGSAPSEGGGASPASASRPVERACPGKVTSLAPLAAVTGGPAGPASLAGVESSSASSSAPGVGTGGPAGLLKRRKPGVAL